MNDKIPSGWSVQYNPKPIPTAQFDWDFWHKDYDDDNRLFGAASSIEDAISQIEEIESERLP